MPLFPTQMYLFHLHGPNGDELWTGCDCFRRGCSASFQNHKSCVILIPFVLYWLLSSCRVYSLAKDRRKRICSFRRACLTAVYSKNRKHLHRHTCPWRFHSTPLNYLITRSRTESRKPPPPRFMQLRSVLPPMCCMRQIPRSRCTSSEPDFRPTVS